MTTPAFVADLLGWRVKGGAPNIADGDSSTSIAISRHILDAFDVGRSVPQTEASGVRLEMSVREFLAEQLAARRPDRGWIIERKRRITEYDQYDHLARLDRLIKGDATGNLSVEIGRDYLVKPDVTVGLPGPKEQPLLHAAVSCKWTLRSDRAQNIRHEAVILTRHRRGRLPHVVAVTAEPLPTRLAALARGTGEVDAVYHVALDELHTATEAVGTYNQRRVLDEIMTQDRLADLDTLADVLAV